MIDGFHHSGQIGNDRQENLGLYQGWACQAADLTLFPVPLWHLSDHFHFLKAASKP